MGISPRALSKGNKPCAAQKQSISPPEHQLLRELALLYA